MPFAPVLPQVLELLARQGWASYRTLRRRFGLDDAALAVLTQHLLATQPVRADDTGTRLVWQAELLYAQTGQPEPARTALATALDLYRVMDMTFWLPETEAVLAQVESEA